MGMGGPGSRAGKIPGGYRGGDLGRHGLGDGSGGAGLGDAGNEALGQLGGTLQGAAGIGADILEVVRVTTKVRTLRAGLRGAMVTDGAAVLLF